MLFLLTSANIRFHSSFHCSISFICSGEADIASGVLGSYTQRALEFKLDGVHIIYVKDLVVWSL